MNRYLINNELPKITIYNFFKGFHFNYLDPMKSKEAFEVEDVMLLDGVLYFQISTFQTDYDSPDRWYPAHAWCVFREDRKIRFWHE